MPPKIDNNKCDLCGKCVFQCGKYVFAFDGEKEKVHSKHARECIDCFVCMLVCPHHAVSMVRGTRRTSKG